MPMIAITTSSSISVNARRSRREFFITSLQKLRQGDRGRLLVRIADNDLTAVAATESAIALNTHGRRQEAARPVHVQELGATVMAGEKTPRAVVRVVRL